MRHRDLERPFFVRIAGVPATILPSLSLGSAFVQAENVVTTRERLTRQAGELSDVLHGVIAEFDGTELKPGLVALRRAVFQLRHPGPRLWNTAVRRALPADVVSTIDDWLASLTRWRAELASLPRLVEQGQDASRRAVLEASRDPAFRRALLLASPDLSAELDRCLDGRRRLRNTTAARLAKYLTRAAVKTSPFSTFTITAAGGWGHGDARAVLAEVYGVVELHRGVLSRWRQQLSNRREIHDARPVRVNPSCTVHEGKLVFVTPSPREPITAVPLSATLLTCLQLVRARPGLTLGQLRDQLSAGIGDKNTVDAYVDRLVGSGLVEFCPPTADQSADPLSDLVAWLETVSPETLDKVGEALQRLRQALRQIVPVDDLDGFRRQCQVVQAAVDDIDAGLGGPSSASRVRQFPGHDNAMTGSVMALSEDRWTPVVADLDTVRRWLAIHDALLPLRLGLAAHVSRHFGAGVRLPFLVLHRWVQREIAAATPVGAELSSLLKMMVWGWTYHRGSVERIAEAERLRDEAIRMVLAHPESGGVIRVPPSVLTRHHAGWPAWVATPRSVTCYVQATGPEDTPSAVVNYLTTGYGRGIGRWLRLADAAGLPRADHGWAGGHQDVADAEIAGDFGSALNLRAPTLPYEITYPWSASARPATETVGLGELVVAHDPETDLLELWWPDRELRLSAHHLGMIADALLPPAARLLRGAFGGMSDARSGFLRWPLAPTRPPARVVRHPRVEVGRVVLRRTRWTVPARQLPRQDAGEPDATYLVRLVSWLHANDIPNRCFVRVRNDARFRAAYDGDDPRWIFGKSRKPMFVDFANWYLVQALHKLVTSENDLVVLEEALPDPRERVTELMFDLSEPVVPDA